MKIFSEAYFNFLIFCFLYFVSSQQGLCYAREGYDFRSAIPSLVGQENNNNNNNNYYNESTINLASFNVLKYGAKGDGATNDAQAFVKAWNAACQVNGGVVLVPAGYTFLLQPVDFDGSFCQPNTVVQIDGKIVAPADISEWTKVSFQWIQFRNSRKGLIIGGNGVIDGQGEPWWKNPKRARPTAVRIANSSNVVVTGITIQNPPQMHLFIDFGQYLQIYNFKTSAPADSPNTDGIHISNFQHAVIHNNTLACGDDCVSIQKGCVDIKVYNVNCGPGHGYSIGGLGPNSSEAEVSDVSVYDSTVQNSLTGVRIKTWPGGSGFVRNVLFSNIQMTDVGTAIVIDQAYCGGPKTCEIRSSRALAISNVTFEKLTGSFTYRSVYLLCSQYNPCRGLTAATINLVPSPKSKSNLPPQCSNARGRVLTKTTPPLNNCLMGQPQGAQVPAASPGTADGGF